MERERQADLQKIAYLKKKLKRKKYISILLALFTFGVNIFAWFAFSANAGLELDGNVASWDVEFNDSGQVIRNIFIEVAMKPGMTDFSKTVEVINRSDVAADFSYEIVSLSIMGKTVNVASKPNIVNYLDTFYPFSITSTASSNTISSNGTIDFTVDVTWPYETNTTTYYLQDEVYEFNETFEYYKNVNNVYSIFDVPSDTVYENNKSTLYLEKDDADSYFGMGCHTYESTTGNSCLLLTMRLLVQQSNQ